MRAQSRAAGESDRTARGSTWDAAGHGPQSIHHLTGTRCASCGATCGPGTVYCPGAQLIDGTIDYREAHALCRECLDVMASSQAGLETICARIERALAWRGHA